MLGSVSDLFYDYLRDIYYAEKAIMKSLPKLERAATNPDLKAAFARHRDETEGQVERLQKIFELLGKPARAKTCEAINGITEEANELLEDSQPGPVRDAGLVAAAQAVEHYEIGRYGAMIAWAKAQQRQEIVQLLEQTLAEEKNTDALLNKLANGKINQEALKVAA